MEEKQKKYFDLTLWLAQALLATDLVLAAFTKLTTTYKWLYEMLPWTKNMWLLLGTSLVDVVVAIALFMPAAIDSKNKWTIYAGFSSIAINITACASLMYYGISEGLTENIACIAIGIFMVWGRTKLPTIKHKETIRAEKEKAESDARAEEKRLKREEAKRLKLEAKKLKSLQLKNKKE